jgi:hypothetical protein
MDETTRRIAAAAARLVADEGMEPGPAKRRAARDFGARAALPDNEAVEDAVREHLAIFAADTQPAELRALRELAARWMRRFPALRPHLSGAAWRGTATRLSALHIDLYCDDPKVAELTLIDAGVAYDVQGPPGDGTSRGNEVLAVAAPCPALGREPVTLFLRVNDHDDLRGALKADSRGRAWRGDLAALERLLAAEGAA